MNARINRNRGAENPSEPAQNNRGNTSLYGVPDTDMGVPVLTPDILQYLNKMFPDSLSLVTRMGSMEKAEGARAVVEHLLQVHQEQQDEPNVLRRQTISPSPADSPGPAAAAHGQPRVPGL